MPIHVHTRTRFSKYFPQLFCVKRRPIPIERESLLLPARIKVLRTTPPATGSAYYSMPSTPVLGVSRRKDKHTEGRVEYPFFEVDHRGKPRLAHCSSPWDIKGFHPFPDIVGYVKAPFLCFFSVVFFVAQFSTHSLPLRQIDVLIRWDNKLAGVSRQ